MFIFDEKRTQGLQLKMCIHKQDKRVQADMTELTALFDN